MNINLDPLTIELMNITKQLQNINKNLESINNNLKIQNSSNNDHIRFGEHKEHANSCDEYRTPLEPLSRMYSHNGLTLCEHCFAVNKRI